MKVLEILRQLLTVLLIAGQVVEVWGKIKRTTFRTHTRR